MTTETLDVRVTENGSRVVRRNIEEIGQTAIKAESGVDFLKRALGALSAFLAINKVRQWADAWSTAAGQIRVATKNTAEAVAVQDELFKSAQRTRQPFEDMVQLYGRVARAGKELGTNQAELIKFTENIGKALAVQGGNAEQSKGALLQLGQALGSGVVRAEEFNSVLEGAPYILQAAANQIKGVDGSISKLRQKMLAGNLTSKEFFDAIQRGSGAIEADFQKSAITITQSLTLINNAMIKYIGQLDESLGVSKALGQGAKFIAENINEIGTALLAAGAAMAVVFSIGPIIAFTKAIATLFILINANPFIALAAAIAAVSVWLYKFSDTVLVGVDCVTTLQDVLAVLGEYAMKAFDTLYYAAVSVFGDLANLATSAYAAVTGSTEGAAEDWRRTFGSFYDDVGTGFAGVVKGIAKTLDAIGGLITGLFIGIGRIIGGIPDLFSNVFSRAYNAVVGTIEDMINTVIGGINKLRAFVGTEPLELVKFTKMEVDEAAFEKYGQGIAQSIDAGFESQGGFLQKAVDTMFDDAASKARERIRNLKRTADVDLTASLGKGTKAGPTDKELKALHALENKLKSLLGVLDPVKQAFLEMKDAQVTLDKAQKAGLITEGQKLVYVSKLNDVYRDQVDPLGAVNREMDVQLMLSGMSARSYEVENQFLQIKNELLGKNVTLTDEQEKALRGRLITMQNVKDATAAENAFLQASVETRKNFVVQLEALQKLLADPLSGFTKGDAAQAGASLLSQMGLDPAQTAIGIEAQIAQFQNMYDQIAQMRAAGVINAQDEAALTAQVWAQSQAAQLKGASDFFGQLSEMQNSRSKTAARIGKAAAIAQATIKTYESATSAYAAMAGIPYVGPALGVAAAAAAVAAGLANVQAIRSAPAGFKEGGYTGNMGINDIAGVVHGREFVADAETTATYRPALEAMQRGTYTEGNGGGLKLSVVNMGTPQEYQVEQISREEYRLIARDEARKVVPETVSAEISDANSRTSRALRDHVQGGGRRR